MTATDVDSMKALDPAYVSSVLRALLIEAGRDILVEDGPRRDLIRIPFDAASPEPKRTTGRRSRPRRWKRRGSPTPRRSTLR